jgi:periplasmic divalent cation tolerance protein
MSDYYLVITSWPDFDDASQHARSWLDKKLVASVNILPQMHSIYLWKGKFKSGTEHQMLLKTTADKVELLENTIRQQHPYPVAEILRVAIDSGNPDYLQWISKATR